MSYTRKTCDFHFNSKILVTRDEHSSLSANLSLMFAKLLRKKFAGVQQPLGRWIIRHVLEFIVLSPAILVTWLYLKLRKFEVIIVGVASSAISSFLTPLEPELRKLLNTKIGLKKTIVLNLSDDANSYLRKLYDQIVIIFGSESRFRRRLIWWASKFGIQTMVPDQSLSDSAWVALSPSVKISAEDNEIGYEYLKSIGVRRNQHFICYATRTESYYQKLIAEGVVLKPRSIRNPNEQSYLNVGLNLLEMDLAVIRMGKNLSTSLTTSEPRAVVDYATISRTDALDLFLLSKCKFLLTGGSGIIWLRRLFNLPSLHCDSYDIRSSAIFNELFLFQRVRHISSGEFATISEMLKMRSEYSDERHQGRLGVELIKNTADEILAACNEMNSRIDGTWITTPQDEELQQRYLDLVVTYSDQPTWRGGGRVGTQFLRDNQDLLR